MHFYCFWITRKEFSDTSGVQRIASLRRKDHGTNQTPGRSHSFQEGQAQGTRLALSCPTVSCKCSGEGERWSIFFSAVHSGAMSLPHLSLENKALHSPKDSLLSEHRHFQTGKRLTKHWSTYVFLQTETVYKTQIPRLCCSTILGFLRVPREIGQEMI